MMVLQGKIAQIGIFKGSVNEFNDFLLREQVNGSVYLHSDMVGKNKFYFSMIKGKNVVGSDDQN